MSIWLAAGVLLSLTLAEGQTISGPNTIGIGQDLTLFCNFVPGVGQTIHIYQWSFTGAVTGLTLFDDCTVFNEGDLAVLSYTKQCNGNDFTLTLQAVTQYTLSKRWCCNVGLVAGGAGTESCKTVGIDADCGNPTEPTNGQVTFTTTTYQSTATYSCDSGYTIDGTATTTCQADGTWSGSVPTCTGTTTTTTTTTSPIPTTTTTTQASTTTTTNQAPTTTTTTQAPTTTTTTQVPTTTTTTTTTSTTQTTRTSTTSPTTGSTGSTGTRKRSHYQTKALIIALPTVFGSIIVMTTAAFGVIWFRKHYNNKNPNSTL